MKGRETAYKADGLHAFVVCAVATTYSIYQVGLQALPSVLVGQFQDTLHLDSASFGLFASAFFFTYLPGQILAGVLLDRFGPRWLLTASAVLAGASTMALAEVGDLPAAIALRMVAGLASAIAFPSALMLAAEWLSPRRFFFAATLLEGLGFSGGAACQLFVPPMISALGGEQALIASGAVGVVASVAVALVVRRGPLAPPVGAAGKASIGQVLGSPHIWRIGVSAGLGATVVAGFLASWAPTFLQARLGLAAVEAGRISALGFIGLAIGAPLWGLLGPRIASARTCMVIGLATAGVLAGVLIEGPKVGPEVAAVLLFATGASSGAYALVFGLVEQAAPPQARGAALGLANLLVMGVGSVVLTPAVGGLLEIYGSAKRQAPTAILGGPVLDDAFAAAFGAAAWLYVLAPILGAMVLISRRPNA